MPALFKNLEDHLAQIPQEERYNLFYTTAQCLEEPGRKMASQEVVPWDIDGIEREKYAEYITPVCNILGVSAQEIGIVFTGNGLHFLILQEDPFYEESYFEENRVYYKAICGEINQALEEAGLPGKADPAVWSKGRILRLPGTENRKESKGVHQAFLINAEMRPLDFNLQRASRIPMVEHGQYVSQAMLKRLPPADKEGVLSGCNFIKWCYDNQPDVSEPQWYALLSIIGRLPDGRELAHEYSQEHPKYSKSDTDRKLEQAITVAGPRTCQGISELWDGCPECPNFAKCTSPINLVSTEHIRTEHTGFHDIIMDEKGIEKKKIPNHDDLVKYFCRLNPAVTHVEGRMLYVWRDGYWQDYPRALAENFAENHYVPKPKQATVQEFYSKLLRTTVKTQDFFDPEDVINFNNGVLDIETGEFMAHSPHWGFRYKLAFDYDPKATAPRFEKYLNEVTGHDPEVIQVLLEYMGYALCGVDPAIGQKALILTGGGANGKSVFLDLLKHMAGKNNYSTVSLGHEIANINNRYSLDGKLFNITEETPTRSLMDSSLFKAIVAGGEVQAKKLYCDSYSMRTRAKLILACNELPENFDYSYGMIRRLLIVPFNSVFTEANRDVNIREKLYAEGPGAFNLAYAALGRFLSQGRFSESDKLKETLEEFKNDNPIRTFCLEKCLLSPTAVVPFDSLYRAYRLWCEDVGIRAENKISFSKRLLTGFPQAQREQSKVGGKTTRLIRGYGLLQEEPENF